jgi:hypothetical protein
LSIRAYNEGCAWPGCLKEQFQTELETWRYLPSQTIEFTMKRLREPIESGG